jgi:hypothetical protein
MQIVSQKKFEGQKIAQRLELSDGKYHIKAMLLQSHEAQCQDFALLDILEVQQCKKQ